MTNHVYIVQTIQALVTASTKANFDKITDAAETLCKGMINHNHISQIIEALIGVSDNDDKFNKIADAAKTLFEGISRLNLDEDKDEIIKALITASTKANFDEITNAAIKLCNGMLGSGKHETIEALIEVSANANFDKITEAAETLCEDMDRFDKAKTISINYRFY